MGILKNFVRDMAKRYDFRTVAFAVTSIIINAGYIAFNVVFGIITKNVWYGALAVYYFILSLLRGLVIYWDKTAKKRACGNGEVYYTSQLKNYRHCGILLFALDIGMSFAVTLMVLQQKPAKYTTVVAIAVAAYTIYKLTLAIRNFLKAKRGDKLHVQSLRNIGLADAAVALLSMQTALVATFSEDSSRMLALNAITGFAVCAFVMAMGVIMIARANIKLKIYKK